jgi:hypothetical protein
MLYLRSFSFSFLRLPSLRAFLCCIMAFLVFLIETSIEKTVLTGDDSLLLSDGTGYSDGGFGNRSAKRPQRRERDDKVHDSIIEERIQRERPCRTLFIRNIKASIAFEKLRWTVDGFVLSQSISATFCCFS